MALIYKRLARATSNNKDYKTAWARQQERMKQARPLRKTTETFAQRDSLHERS